MAKPDFHHFLFFRAHRDVFSILSSSSNCLLPDNLSYVVSYLYVILRLDATEEQEHILKSL